MVGRLGVGLMLICATAFTVKAQNNALVDQLYFGASAGANTYLNGERGSLEQMRYHFDAMAGLSLYKRVGFRGQLLLYNAVNGVGVGSFYFGGHFDMTYRLVSWNRKDQLRPNELQGFLGFGVVRRLRNALQGADNDFCVAVGVNFTTPLYNNTYLLAEVGAIATPSHFDNNERVSCWLSGSVGVMHRLSNNPYRNGIAGSSQKNEEDWYLSIGAGLNTMVYSPAPSMKERVKELGPDVSVAIGKYLSPVTNIRLSMTGVQAGMMQKRFMAANLHGDILFNINNMFYPKQNRVWNFSVLVGGGIINRWDYRIAMPVIRGGMQLRLWVSKQSDLYLEGSYDMMPSEFAHLKYGQRMGVGMAEVKLGYCYNLGRGTRR